MRTVVRKVNRSREYDVTNRREEALARHAKTLDVAERKFFEHGYAATTVESIAEDAGISAATVYKSYGGKAGLIKALCQRALEGSGPVPAEDRSNALRVNPDPRDVIAGWGRLAAEVAPRVIPLLLLLRDAAHLDPESAALLSDLNEARLTRMADNARYLVAGGHLKDGISPEHARDTLWLYSSAELYDLLINDRQWSISQYSRFITDAMTSALL